MRGLLTPARSVERSAGFLACGSPCCRRVHSLPQILQHKPDVRRTFSQPAHQVGIPLSSEGNVDPHAVPFPHELLLEIIPPTESPRAPDTVLRALKRLYNLEIYTEWWKLEPMSAAQWQAIDALIVERDPYCRGVVLLGLGASVDELIAGFREARGSKTCRGFAVGRTIFHEASRTWLAGECDDATLKRMVRERYEVLIRHWREARSVPEREGVEA